ncbi:agmatine deiminase family protein [Porticoccus sp.]|uniref:agmatine deiminase family protein n=1 Tax=Porticoccus sp. TaxID=2024853 RepID=UPI000C4B329F|nr:agmatine deiminase family protein [Porticoccus sp.]MAZ71198.1 agmatine deiminase [Porticoccus sp.]|tara:strand:+ start:24563 stop:25609 length:1047 start_codon:yes stop_codon:yes gene_type:complete
MTNYQVRLPAEWEPQDAIQLTWPHAGTDWKPILNEIIPVYETLVRLLTGAGEVIITVLPTGLNSLSKRMSQLGISADKLQLFPVETNDTWVRDYGPVTVETDHGLYLLDYQFNAWGNKHPCELDNALTSALFELGAYPGASVQKRTLVLEGGSIETDGNGTLLTTAQCLLNPNRNPSFNQTEIEQQLCKDLGVKKINWLQHGALQGDDTDSHIDTLARLCPNNVIAYQACDDITDSHYPELQLMADELQDMTSADGSSYRLIPLPWPSAKYDQTGQRLPATYANFLVFNHLVIVPTYRDTKDSEALAQLAKAFPGYQVEGVDCLPVIQQHGSLHCITMQLPKGTLNAH